MKYVAFLRGINVGGHAIVKMADLKLLFESLGLENVQTFIQSGNVIFESEENAESLARQIERQLEKTMGHEIRLFVRTIRQVRSIAEKSPFTAKAGETVHVTFLNKASDKKRRQALMSLKSEADDFAVKGSEIYNLRRDRDKSIFSNNLIEKTLKLPATTRNMTVIRKIAEKYNK
jgi:uncharacterized protein (DUF1697 family)